MSLIRAMLLAGCVANLIMRMNNNVVGIEIFFRHVLDSQLAAP